MAIQTSLRKSSTSIEKIAASLNQTRESIQGVQVSVDSFSKMIETNTKFRSQLYARSEILSYRINEARNRNEREDKLEANKVGTPNPNLALGFGARSAGGIFGKLIAFASYLTAGWIINNFQIWQQIGGEFINRLTILKNNLVNFGPALLDVFSKLGSALTSSLVSILTLDFSAFTEGQVKEDFDALNAAVRSVTQNIQDSYTALTTPLTEAVEGGGSSEGGGDTSGQYDPGEYDQSSGSGVGTAEQQALLSTIRYAEGTAGPTGYSMFFGDRTGEAKYGDLTNKSIAEVEELVTKFLQDPQSEFGNGQRSAAVGAYQFIDITGLAKSVGMSTDRNFDKEFQDELALRLAAKRESVLKFLEREGLSDSVIKKLSPEWASFPGNNYGQPTKAITSLRETYNRAVERSRNTTTSSNISGYRVTRSGRNIPSLSALPDHHSNTRTSDGRLVQDFTLFKGDKFLNLPVPSPVSGTVTWAGNAGNGGLWVEIQSPEGKVEMGHFNSLRVKKGDKVGVGSILGLQGHTGRTMPSGPDGTHIHIQAPDSVLERYIQMINSNSFSETKVSSANINPSPSRNAETSNIASSKAAQVIAIDASQIPVENNYSPMPAASPMVASISEGQLLNRLNKNKLLTDLAYT